MSDLTFLRKQAQPLYAFVYKYFEKLDPAQLNDLRYDFVLSPLEVYELTQKTHALLPELFKSTSEEADVMDLWAHKELVLQALVVLTNIPLMSEPLLQKGLLQEAVQLRDQLIDGFTQKAIEDPNVLYAIQTGTIDEEIEKRREARELYNFKPLFEQHQTYVIEPEGINFQEIPERF